jgi:hypothetical protein
VSASAIIDNDTQQAVDPASLSAEALRAGLASGQYSVEPGGNVGYVFTNPVTGAVKYGVKDPATGNMYFTDTNPWTSTTINTGNGLTVFGTSLVERGGKQVVDPNGVMGKPVNIDTADPLMSDSTVAPKDLLTLTESGAVTGLTDEKLARYQARLQRAEAKRLTEISNRDRGLADMAGTGRDEITTGGGGDLRVDVLNSVKSITPTVQSLFGSPSQKEADFTPPPAPTPRPSRRRPRRDSPRRLTPTLTAGTSLHPASLRPLPRRPPAGPLAPSRGARSRRPRRLSRTTRMPLRLIRTLSSALSPSDVGTPLTP